MKKNLKNRWLLLGSLTLACLTGCQQESKEYLRALEAKDRLIERSHKARRDIIDSLGHRRLDAADQAMEAEMKVEEDTLYVDALLDSHRPHKPDPVLYEQARQLVVSLVGQLEELKGQWVSVSKNPDPEVAKELSKKIRDVEMALAEASETAKRAKPIAGTSQQVEARQVSGEK